MTFGDDVWLHDKEFCRAGWTVRTFNCIVKAGLTSIPKVADSTAERLMAIPNFGANSLANVRCVLAAHGLSLRVEGCHPGSYLMQRQRRNRIRRQRSA